ncbi:flavin monoamine oxidase family protein [Actinokineospora sp. 24-640]
MGWSGEYDAVVVGAGFAWLSAADALLRAGLTVRVLEARSRVGGRVLTRYLPDGTQLDLAASGSARRSSTWRGLVDRYGVRTYPTPDGGVPVFDLDDRHLTGTPPEVAEIFAELGSLSRQVCVEEPWSGPWAEQWDRSTVATWLEGKRVPPAVFRFVDRMVCGGLLAGSAADTSLLETLFHIASVGGAKHVLGDEDTAEDIGVVGGPQQIAERMAAGLPPGTLHLADPVLGIEHDTTARVHTRTSSYRAARVIVAVPPTLAGRIRYDPPLPALREAIFQRMPAGTALKVHAVYPEPFWRSNGLSGVARSTTSVSPKPSTAPRRAHPGPC